MSSCDMAAGEDVLRVCYEQVGEDELQQARHDGLLVHGLLLWSKVLMISRQCLSIFEHKNLRDHDICHNKMWLLTA